MAGKTVVSDDEEEIEVEEEDRDEEPADGEAVEGDGDDDEDDEDDEEGQDEFEDDGFIVDEADEEPEDEENDRTGGDMEKQKKKKRKKRESEKNYVLDEDDYELLQDNNVGYRRPKSDSKKFKRLKKAQRDDEGPSGFSDEEEYDRGGKNRRTDVDKVGHSLFGDDGGPHLEDINEEEPLLEEDEGYNDELEEDDDGMGDFIVEEEELDENGAPVRRRKMNRKKSRGQASGVSSAALEEAHDLFGDVEELLKIRRQGLARLNREESGDRHERKLEDEFEPSILSEKFMTEKDDTIRQIDIPERMQVSEEATGPPTEDTSIIDVESDWIHNQLTTTMSPLLGELSISKDDITRFLELTHVRKLDVPFIAMYRKEDCLSLIKDPEDADDDKQKKSEKKPTLRWRKILWAVQDLDKKWLLLQKRKSALGSYYQRRYDEEARSTYDETRLNLNHQLYESIKNSLETADSEREIDDVDLKFNLHFPLGEVNVDEGQFKRPKRKSQYTVCSKAGLWEVANKFGYSSEQFGLQISLQEMRMDELEDAKETPEEVASNFTCAMFETPQAVLRGARHMAAVEISCEPCVRKHVRGYFMDNAVVSTTPTPNGNIAIDTYHQYAGIKWLKDKPLSRFEDAQWLLIQKAEEEKLIQVSVKLPEPILNKLTSDSEDYYLSDGVSKSAQLWNEQRKLILQDAFLGFLLPSMAKEARAFLTSKAKSWVLMEYGKVLWDKVSIGPYQKKDSVEGAEDEAAPRVMACCWGSGDPAATTFVILDSSGEVLDILYTPSLSIRNPRNPREQEDKKKDQQHVLKFMTDHQPQVVVLGAANLNCTKLKEDIYEIIFKMVEDNPRDVGHEMDGLSIVYGDESLPRLYENSRISTDQLPAQTGIIRRAVALGRYLQNPLAMVATLCGPGKEILSWKLGPFDSFLTSDEKYAMIEQVMVEASNQVGLDVNLASSHEWLFSYLQFTSGLGPRKASFLQRNLVRAGATFSRKDILQSLGKKVFVNAVGFLRFRRTGHAASSSQFMDILDDTRIHPESYTLAAQLAKDVYSMDVEDDNPVDDDDTEMAIEHVREKPHLLKALIVDTYCKSKSLEDKRETIDDIRLELIHGFQDWRRPYVELSQDEEFYLISGESEDTLSEGRIVQATVRKVQGQRAFCVLESGLTGVLNKEDFTDEWRDVHDLTEKLSECDIVTCKIKSIQKNRYQVFLNCKESELRNSRFQSHQNLDPYYHEDRSCLQNEQDKTRKKKELAKKHFKPRMIVHPRFQNITADEAMEFLSDKEPGESIVRPSSRGPSFLTLTLKIYDEVYAHKDIIEGGKEHKDITSMLRIGKTLKIGDDTFEDLDEVMDRYVDPLVTHLKTMLSYRKFKRGAKAEVDEVLKIEKSENPMRIVYCFGISHEHPGTFILSFIRGSNPHHEYIGLYPKGFKFRKKMFEDIDRLVGHFQRHIDDPQDASGPSIRSVAAMVPMRSPAPGSGSFGGSNDGGWRDNRDRASTPASRSGRNDYRNGGRSGSGSVNVNRNDERRANSRWDSKDAGSGDNNNKNWDNFPGAKVQNSPVAGGWSGGATAAKRSSSVQSDAAGGGWGSW